MSNSTVNSFKNVIESFLESSILPQLVEYVNEEHGLETPITVQELLNVLNVEREQDQPNKGTLTLKLPNVQTSSKRGTVKKQLTEDEQCKYVYKKHPRIGKQCPNKRQDDSEFCKACSRKKTAIDASSQNKLTSIGFSKSVPDAAQKVKVYVDPMIDYPDCYEMKEHKYIVKQIHNGEYLCVGTKTDEKDVFEKITPEDEKELNSLGFKYRIVDNVKETMLSSDAFKEDNNDVYE